MAAAPQVDSLTTSLQRSLTPSCRKEVPDSIIFSNNFAAKVNILCQGIWTAVKLGRVYAV